MRDIEVQFTDVGREKKSWTDKLKKLTHRSLLKSVRSNARLMSRHIDFDIDKDGKGFIFAGLHCVGTFVVKADPIQPANTIALEA